MSTCRQNILFHLSPGIYESRQRLRTWGRTPPTDAGRPSCFLLWWHWSRTCTSQIARDSKNHYGSPHFQGIENGGGECKSLIFSRKIIDHLWYSRHSGLPNCELSANSGASSGPWQGETPRLKVNGGDAATKSPSANGFAQQLFLSNWMLQIWKLACGKCAEKCCRCRALHKPACLMP